MATIWVVEDDPEFLELYKFLLDREGFAVEAFGDGQSLLAATATRSPDMLLLDLGLPGESGLDILQAFRADPRHAGTPVLVATASKQAADKYRSLCLADDYLSKPFDPIEFVLRVKARLRSAGTPQAPDFLTACGLTLNCALHEVDSGGTKTALTPSEFEILRYLMERPNRPVSVEILLTEALGYPSGVGNPDALRNHVRQLRVKIETDPANPVVVVNVPRVGYMLQESPSGILTPS